MKLLIIFGPPAVGKLSVAEAISEKTGFKILHNHRDNDILRPIFDMDSDVFKRASVGIRSLIIETAAESDVNIIFTYVWDFNAERGMKNITHYKNLVEKHNGTVCFLELEADEHIRFERAEHPSRHEKKKTLSGEKMKEYEKGRNFNTIGEFHLSSDYLRICNTNLSPEEVAIQVIDYYSL